jgi:3-isopropylmalate/(R)-2-methylmalate dehydratase large subunit
MGMTITEKIFFAHCKEKSVKAGDFVTAKVDLVLANDITAPISMREFRKIGFKKVFDRNKVVLVPDHFTPNKDIKSAEQCLDLRNFARNYRIENYFEVGEMGIEHALLPELGLVLPGDLVVGADSHTCTYGALGAFSTGIGSTDAAIAMGKGELWFKIPETILFRLKGNFRKWAGAKDLILHIIGMIGVDGALYKAMEFSGDGVKNIDMDGRFTVANMVVEAGAKNGIFAPDDLVFEYISQRAKRSYKVYHSDENASYDSVHEIDLDNLEPLVSFPHLPSNIRKASESTDVNIDQVVIGSCTNGRLSDLRTAASILDGRKVKKGMRLIVIPATQSIYLQAMREGLLETFVLAGGVVSTPTCGPCLGGHMGILARGERALSTTNRNFVGRMGHPESEIYLASPAVAAATAVMGRIAHPVEVMG